ncbi:MAG: hypothetical protein O2955_02945 [Planctomycetota bacterium]|nr:hypothetical protein [Planctomycetota bacterium]MDA1211444.1 hypothetical protein [Planctomycetota bacterium]
MSAGHRKTIVTVGDICKAHDRETGRQELDETAYWCKHLIE